RNTILVTPHEYPIALRDYLDRALLIHLVRLVFVVRANRAAARNPDLRAVAARHPDIAFQVIEEDARFFANRFLLGYRVVERFAEHLDRAPPDMQGHVDVAPNLVDTGPDDHDQDNQKDFASPEPLLR